MFICSVKRIDSIVLPCTARGCGFQPLHCVLGGRRCVNFYRWISRQIIIVVILGFVAFFTVMAWAEEPTADDFKIDWKFTPKQQLFSPPKNASPEEMLKWSREQDSPVRREEATREEMEKHFKANDEAAAMRVFHAYREQCANLTLSIVHQILATDPPFELEQTALRETWFPYYLLVQIDKEKYLPIAKKAYANICELSRKHSKTIDEKTAFYFWLRHPMLRDILEVDPGFLPEADTFFSDIDVLLKREPFGKFSDDLRRDKFQLLRNLSQTHEKFKEKYANELKTVATLFEKNKEKFGPQIYDILFWGIDVKTPQGQRQLEQWTTELRTQIRENEKTKIWDAEQRGMNYRLVNWLYGWLIDQNFTKSSLLIDHLEEMERMNDPDLYQNIANGYTSLWNNRYVHFAREGGSDEELEQIFHWIDKNIQYGQGDYDRLGDTIASRSCLGDDPYEKCTPKQQEYFLRQCLKIFETLTKLERQWKAEGKSLRYRSYAETFSQYEGYLALPGSTVKFSGMTLQGQPFKSETLRGKTVLLDFWATWCGPCIQEIPEMKALYERYHEQGFEIIGIGIEDQQTLENFLKKTPLPWIVLHDPESKLFKQFHGLGVPHCVLIDSEGKIIMTDARGKKLREKLEALFPAK